MRLPLSWLKEFNETDLSIEALANLLTRAGLEVESIDRIGIYSDSRFAPYPRQTACTRSICSSAATGREPP